MANKHEHFVADIDKTQVAEIDAVRISEKPTNLYLDAWRDLRTRPMFYIAGALIILVSLMAIFPTWFTQVAPNDNCLLENSNGAPTGPHLLGFTRQGCDIFSRIVHGTSTSLSVGLIVTLMTLVMGVFFGSLAGFYGIPFESMAVTTAEQKAAFEKRLLEVVEENDIELVVLARYMQVLSPELCKKLKGKIDRKSVV